MKKIILALQFWPGDVNQALSLARLIADIAPSQEMHADFLFVNRFDCPFDTSIISHMAPKFSRVWSYQTRRQGTGFPHGPNDMWHDLTNYLAKEYRNGTLDQYDGVLTFEGDCVPLAKNWIHCLWTEWQNAKAAGKKICGWYGEHPPHINGNAIFHLDLPLTIPGLAEGSPFNIAWDAYQAPKLLPIAYISNHFVNNYRCSNLHHDDLFRNKGEFQPSLLHGCKDYSGQELARLKLVGS